MSLTELVPLSAGSPPLEALDLPGDADAAALVLLHEGLGDPTP